MKRKIGFIGLGDMGSRMASRLMAAGHHLLLCDVNRAALATFAAEGATCTESPADAARADLVILMVSDDSQLESAVLGLNGIARGIDPARRSILLIMSTCLPKTVIAIRDAVASSGVRVVDAPVSGGLSGAEQGTLSIMAGGAPEDIEAVMPVLRCMGRDIFDCGPLGSAQVCKLVNNMIALTNIFLVSEAFEIAQKSGVELARLASVLEASSGRTSMSKDIRTSCLQYASWSNSAAAFEALSRIVRKDVALVGKLANDAGVEAPVLKSVSGVLGHPKASALERWKALGKTEFVA